MSVQIRLERNADYKILERTQKGTMDVTPWMEWFLGGLGRAIDGALETLGAVLDRKQFWDRFKDMKLNDRRMKVINRLVDGFEGNLATSRYAALAKCLQDTAHRDLMDLIERHVLVQNAKGGRSTSYSLAPKEQSRTSRGHHDADADDHDHHRHHVRHHGRDCGHGAGRRHRRRQRIETGR